jgi:hypothetical protein
MPLGLLLKQNVICPNRRWQLYSMLPSRGALQTQRGRQASAGAPDHISWRKSNVGSEACLERRNFGDTSVRLIGMPLG